MRETHADRPCDVLVQAAARRSSMAGGPRVATLRYWLRDADRSAQREWFHVSEKLAIRGLTHTTSSAIIVLRGVIHDGCAAALGRVLGELLECGVTSVVVD